MSFLTISLIALVASVVLRIIVYNPNNILLKALIGISGIIFGTVAIVVIINDSELYGNYLSGFLHPAAVPFDIKILMGLTYFTPILVIILGLKHLLAVIGTVRGSKGWF